jgi:hypothetical protein
MEGHSACTRKACQPPIPVHLAETRIIKDCPKSWVFCFLIMYLKSVDSYISQAVHMVAIRINLVSLSLLMMDVTLGKLSTIIQCLLPYIKPLCPYSTCTSTGKAICTLKLCLPNTG